MLAMLVCAGVLIPQSAPIGEAHARVKDPLRDAGASDEVRRGYLLFENTPKYARRYTQAALSCGSCHLNAGQKDGAMPLLGIAAVFPEYNRRAGRMFTLEDRVVG
jgi:thiosulfate dehydrogenase